MALDQGTTSSRTILLDKKGNIVCQANKEFEQIFFIMHNFFIYRYYIKNKYEIK